MIKIGISLLEPVFCVVMKFFFFALTFFFITIGTPAEAAELQGRVISISDGDTLTVLTPDKAQLKIRLVEIDAPESGQPYGKKAKQALSDLIFGQDVTVQYKTKDRYGRILGRVFIDELDVNLRLVELGAAWAYDQYLTDPNIKKAENRARDSKAGLWNLPAHQIMPPWDWRYADKSSSQRSDAEVNGQNQISGEFSCRGKRYCREMGSCAEAKFYLHKCGLSRLDGDGDGVPCEKICR